MNKFLSASDPLTAAMVKISFIRIGDLTGFLAELMIYEYILSNEFQCKNVSFKNSNHQNSGMLLYDIQASFVGTHQKMGGRGKTAWHAPTPLHPTP